jgi:polyketide synthase-associated protein
MGVWPQVGSAVQTSAGKIGQLVKISGDNQAGDVLLTDGTTADAVALSGLKSPENPGFDILVGQMLNMDVLADEAAKCLFSKGYCVLQVCDGSSCDEAVAFMRGLGDESHLTRLPEEVEEGYLGLGAKGKVAWFEDDLPVEASLKAADDFMTTLAYAMLPYSSDAVGGVAEQRTAALLSLSLTNADVSEYPSPFADDKVLGTYLNTFNRGLLKAVHFMGPATVSVLLASKEDEDSLPDPPSSVAIEAGPGTILLFRPKSIDMKVAPSSEYLSMTVTFMEAEKTPQIVGRWDAADSLNTMSKKYPSRPGKECCSIVNTSTRLGAQMDDPDFYNAALSGGIDCAVEFSKARFDWEDYYCADVETAQPWQICTRHMSYIEGIDGFDNKYFNIPTNEAAGMDPMQRVTLETGAMNMYQLGITKKFADRNPHHGGCCVGLDKDDWQATVRSEEVLRQLYASPQVQAIISNRFSFTFNLKGPNFVGDTACSASLACCHFAKLMMTDRKYDMLNFFICLGLHQCLQIGIWVGAHMGHMFSTVARCQTFNETADGYMRGDGCSGLAFKWETPAEEKDVKWRGSMVGQNGRSATLTAPNGVAQEDVIWRAIREAQIEPCDSVAWSCHGTGTSLGDPIEVGSMRKVQVKTERYNQLIVNTNKTNTGHLEGGAAMTSLVAAYLQVRQSKSNPVCHFAVLNPHLEGTDFTGYINGEVSNTNQLQSHMHISSFGFGGTNCHAVLFGENIKVGADSSKMFMKRLALMAPPTVKPAGKDASDWTTDGLEYVANDGDTYSVTILKDDATDQPVKYVLEQEALGPDFDAAAVSYDIVFNDGEQMTMQPGEVPGQQTTILEVPATGLIEFNFVKTMEEELVLAPATDRCRRKTTPISGPAEGLVNKWLIAAPPDTWMRVDLFTSRGVTAVTWLEADI